MFDRQKMFRGVAFSGSVDATSNSGVESQMSQNSALDNELTGEEQEAKEEQEFQNAMHSILGDAGSF